MFTNELTTLDALTSYFPLDNLIDQPSDDIVDGSSQSSTDALTASSPLLRSLSSSDNSISLSNATSSEEVTNTKLDALEILDAPSDDLVLFGSSQPGLGNLGLATTSNLGGLYDDPIEFGTPFSDALYWRQQQGAYSCAVVAQISIFQSLTGLDISESDASNYAQSQGWFDPLSGTPVAYTGNLLDALGIPTYELSFASLYTLQSALAFGDKPIVGLDANEIWAPQYDWSGNPLEQANAGHAVWVTGIDYEWNGSIGIILNDSGTPNGMSSVVNYVDFMNAWQDYDCFVSIADNPLT